MHKFNKIIALAIFFALTGCASSTWTPVEEATFVAPKDSFSVDLPSGWINYTRARNTKVITKDGLELQSIRILRDDHKKAFSAIYLAYGFVNDKGLYTMIYTAPTLHYYDRDVQVFESVVKSFKIQ